jgi:hypothetical protein
VHDFLRHDNWIRAYKASADFLQRKLAGRKGSGSQQPPRERAGHALAAHSNSRTRRRADRHHRVPSVTTLST